MDKPVPLFPDFKTFVYFGIGTLSLLALADFMPRAAILLAIILIAGVVLTHWSDYAGMLQPPPYTKK